MQAILIRVGIDLTIESGNWNAPCNPKNGDFVYVPIRETDRANAPGMERHYANHIIPALDRFSERNNHTISLPPYLLNERMHLDPDFDFLTYGDTDRRGKPLLKFVEDDLVVFYAGLEPIKPITNDRLEYALIGMLVVKEIVQVKDISDTRRFDENAHTRISSPKPTDIVVRGKQDVSGRFKSYIPIGEYRDRAYRVTYPLLDEWGGLCVENGYIHRSANPPLFCQPERFFNWLQQQNPQLIQANNPS
jgi:hypothetical protein